MEKKKFQSISIAALIVSILRLQPLSCRSCTFLCQTESELFGMGQYCFCPAGSDSFNSMCTEQGKPQRYQYRIHSNQRFFGAVDGGNCYTRLVSYFRVVRKLIINLTSKEFDILFITKPKGVFTYELYRQNLPNYIESVAGIGYKFKYL